MIFETRINPKNKTKDELIILLEDALKVINKQENTIDLMSEQLAGLAIFDIDLDEPTILGDKDEVKQYFERKAEEE